MSNEPPLNVSLEPHLAEALTEALRILPDTIASDVKAALDSPRTPVKDVADGAYTGGLISYDLLHRVAQWAHSSDGEARLKEQKLQPSAYSMVALLAGTRTSPERRFPAPDSPILSQELNDRRAITALLNALLSILGSGVAVWWAADRLRWAEEWVSLLAV